jgi:hypothetical protein
MCEPPALGGSMPALARRPGNAECHSAACCGGRRVGHEPCVAHEELERLRDEARQRAQHALEAAGRARERIRDLSGGRADLVRGLHEAEERRIVAEDRLAQVQKTLAEARQRSVNAHERAARVDEERGKVADAAAHREAADRERQLIDDEAEPTRPPSEDAAQADARATIQGDGDANRRRGTAVPNQPTLSGAGLAQRLRRLHHPWDPHASQARVNPRPPWNGGRGVMARADSARD